MNNREYRAAIDCALKFAGAGKSGWNARFLFCLDQMGLCLRPEHDRDLVYGMDVYAPTPYPEDQVTWPVSRIRIKERIVDDEVRIVGWDR